MTRSFVGPALVRGTAAVFFVCIRIDGGRMVPLIFGPMTVSDGIEEKKREKFPSRNLFSFFFFLKKKVLARAFISVDHLDRYVKLVVSTVASQSSQLWRRLNS